MTIYTQHLFVLAKIRFTIHRIKLNCTVVSTFPHMPKHTYGGLYSERAEVQKKPSNTVTSQQPFSILSNGTFPTDLIKIG